MADPLTLSLAAMSLTLACPPATKAIIDLHQDVTEAGFFLTFRARVLFSEAARKEVMQANLRQTLEKIKALLVTGFEDIPPDQLPQFVTSPNKLIDFYNNLVTGEYSVQSHADQRKVAEQTLVQGKLLKQEVKKATMQGNRERMNNDAKALLPSTTVFPDHTLGHLSFPRPIPGTGRRTDDPPNGPSVARDNIHSNDAANAEHLTYNDEDFKTQMALDSVNAVLASGPAPNLPGLHPVRCVSQSNDAVSTATDAVDSYGQTRIETDGENLVLTTKKLFFKYTANRTGYNC